MTNFIMSDLVFSAVSGIKTAVIHKEHERFGHDDLIIVIFECGRIVISIRAYEIEVSTSVEMYHWKDRTWEYGDLSNPNYDPAEVINNILQHIKEQFGDAIRF